MNLNPLRLPKARILVLEEDPKLHTTLCRLLIDAGYTLADAAHGAGTAGHVDLVLTSIGARRTLPARLGMLDRTVSVIALVDGAAWRGMDFFDAANDLGAVAVLQRPFTRAALLQLMAAVLSNPPGNSAAADADADALGPEGAWRETAAGWKLHVQTIRN